MGEEMKKIINKELEKQEMEKAAAGISGYDGARCMTCGGIITSVRGAYMCMNAGCPDFGKSKSKSEIIWR